MTTTDVTLPGMQVTSANRVAARGMCPQQDPLCRGGLVTTGEIEPHDEIRKVAFRVNSEDMDKLIPTLRRGLILEELQPVRTSMKRLKRLIDEAETLANSLSHDPGIALLMRRCRIVMKSIREPRDAASPTRPAPVHEFVFPSKTHH